MQSEAGYCARGLVIDVFGGFLWTAPIRGRAGPLRFMTILGWQRNWEKGSAEHATEDHRLACRTHRLVPLCKSHRLITG